jgi:hypothetical protein
VAFIVENGTGIEDANAYVDEDYVKNYFMGERLTMFSELEDKESVIVSATQLVDISYEWKGTRISIDQGLNWPRDSVEFEGHEIIGIPTALKKAVCEAVFIVMNSDDSLYSNDNQREVVKESVAGAISVEYAQSKDSATKYEVLDKILRGLYCTETLSVLDCPSVGASKVERV